MDRESRFNRFVSFLRVRKAGSGDSVPVQDSEHFESPVLPLNLAVCEQVAEQLKAGRVLTAKDVLSIMREQGYNSPDSYSTGFMARSTNVKALASQFGVELSRTQYKHRVLYADAAIEPNETDLYAVQARIDEDVEAAKQKRRSITHSEPKKF